MRAAYFRRVLRHVAGFPDLRLLCPIRHLVGIRRRTACLDTPCSMTLPVPTPCPGSSPFRVPTPAASSCHFIQEPSGLPGFSNASVPACHGLRTPADLRALAIDGRFVLPSAPLTTSASATSLFRSCSSSSGSAISPAAYRILCLRLDHLVRDLRRSAMDPRLDTGGWLTLTGEPLDSSFPTGTFTRQDALSFSQRDNAKLSRRIPRPHEVSDAKRSLARGMRSA